MTFVSKPITTSTAIEAPALAISDVEITLSRRSQEPVRLVKSASLTLGKGRIHAIVGESGSGKTLLARSIVRLLPPAIGVTGGQILFNGRDLLALPEKEMLRVRGLQIGFVFQEPMLSLNPSLRIGAQMREGLAYHLKLSTEEIRQRCIDMLESVSIRDPEGAFNRYPHEFSGGMRQRIMLASVLALRPQLLIADEPTTALDAIIQRDVLDIMTDLTRDLGTSVLLITYDLGLVGQYAEDVTVMQSGNVRESGSAADVIRRPKHPYTLGLLSACPTRQPRKLVKQAAPTVLRIEDVEMRYRGEARLPWRRAPDFHAVKGVSLDVKEGETVAIVGESGSGKTTLGRAVVGLRPTAAGSVELTGCRVDIGDRASLRNLRMTAQIVFQDPASSLDPRFRIKALVGEGLKLVRGMSDSEHSRRVKQAMSDVGLDPHFGDRFSHELSGGQRQRVALARAIILEPKLIVADEPVSALDVTVQAQVLELLGQLQEEKGFAYLFISHDLGVVEQIADRIVVMRDGRVMEAARRDDIYDRPHHPYTRRLLAASAQVRRQGDGTFQVSRREPPVVAQADYYETGSDYALRQVGADHFVAVSTTR